MVLRNQLRGIDAFGFYLLKLWRWQPVAVTVMGGALLAAAVSAIVLAYAAETLGAARADVQRLRPHNAAPAVVATSVPSAGADLPAFDSAAFTAEFHSIAKDVGLSTDELVYVLENSAAQPFQRYRITLEVKSGYPEVRKFMAALNSAQPHVVLDSLRCRREDAMTASLTCQMAFSAFFRKVSGA